MQLGTLEQLIRIAAYTLGSYFFGQGVADGEMYQAAIGGGVAVLAFAIWAWREYKVKKG